MHMEALSEALAAFGKTSVLLWAGLGAEAMACLAAAGASQVERLEVGLCGLQLGFLTPGLWEVLTRMQVMHVEGPIWSPVEEIVQCFAAAPQPVCVEWHVDMDNFLRDKYGVPTESAQAEVKGQLAALPACTVQLSAYCKY